MVRSFLDLDVYKRLYSAMVRVSKEVTPKLPVFEKYDLVDQIRRASKAPIAIIAEGYARKNYQKDWLKYINEAIGESNEMIAHLSICRDIYGEKFDKNILNSLIKEYDICGKQLYRLGQSWSKRDGMLGRE